MRESFVMYERFAGVAHGALPERSLVRIHELCPCLSRLLWFAWVSRSETHLCTIPADARPAPLARDRVDWGDARSGPAALRRLLARDLDDTEIVVHFWSPDCAALTDAALFTEHWAEFWYPSDDNCVLVLLRDAMRVEFVEEALTLHAIDRAGREHAAFRT